MKGFTKDGKFHPIKPYNKLRKSRDNTTKEQGVRMKRYNVCEPFLEDPASHKPDDTKHTNQVMYSLGDESCASVLTDEEFSMLLTNDQVANTFSPIGETAKKWQQDDAFRKRIIDRAQELNEEQKKVDRKARDDQLPPEDPLVQFKIGDNVRYWGGIGKITHIRYDPDNIEKPKYKINGKYVNFDSLAKTAREHSDKVGSAIVISSNTKDKRLKKLRIELLNNIPTKSDSNKVVEKKRMRFNEIADEMAEIVGLKT